MFNIQKQRQFTIKQKQESEFKLKLAQQRNEIVLNDVAFEHDDRENALKKLIRASALYDKNSPVAKAINIFYAPFHITIDATTCLRAGCVALDAFDSAYLTPGTFREVAKKTFNVVFSENELAAIISLFDDGHGNLDNQKFLVAFIKYGTYSTS